MPYQEGKSRDLLDQVEAIAEMGTWELDLDTMQANYSDGFYRMLGYEPDEFDGLDTPSLFQHVHQEDRGYAQTRLNDAIRTGGLYEVEKRLVRKNGDIIYVRTRGEIIGSVNGESARMTGVMMNITKEKKSEIAISQSRDKFQSLVQSVDGIVWVGDPETFQFTFVSPQSKRILGYDPGEWMNSPDFWVNHIHRNDQDKAIAFCKGMTAKGEDHDFEYRMIASDGRIVWLRDYVTVETDGVKPVKLRGLMVDITRQKMAEEVANRRKSELQRIFDRSHDMIFSLDRDGYFQKINSAVFNTLGYSEEDIIGKSFKKFIHPEDISGTLDLGRKLIEGSGINYFENRCLRKDGTTVHMVWSCDWDEEHQRLYAVGRDATKLKKSEFERRMLIDNTEEAFILIDRDFRVLSFNREYQRLYKEIYSGEIETGRIVLEYIPADRESQAVQLLTEALSGKTNVIERKFKSKRGRQGVYTLQYKPATDDDGNIIGVFISCADITQRHKAEKALEKSEKRFKSLVQEGSDLTCVIDRSGRITYASPTYETQFELKSGELTGRNIIDFIHPDDRQLLQDAITKVKSGSRIRLKPYRIRREGDNWCWIQTTITDLREEEAIGGYVMNSGDISQILQIQQELSTSEARYRGLVETHTSYVIRSDADGILTYANTKFENDFIDLYSRKKLIGSTYLHSVAEQQHEVVLQTVKKCLNHPNEVFQLEIETPLIENEKRTILWDFCCISDSKGKPVEIQCVGIDISGRKQAERELAASLKRYESLSDVVFDAVWEFDLALNKLYLSSKFEDLLGPDAGNSSRDYETFISNIHPDDRKRVVSGIEKLISGEDDQLQQDYRFIKPNGRRHTWVKDNILVIRNEKGQAVRLLGATQDITQERVKEREQFLIAETSKIFTETERFVPATEKVLNMLAGEENFSASELWVISPDGSRLTLAGQHCSDESLRLFLDSGNAIDTETRHISLIGQAWKFEKPQIWHRESGNVSFIRSQIAKQTGLETVVALPVKVHKAMVGVMLFASVENYDSLKEFISIIERIGNHLGSEIRRKMYEEDLNQIFRVAPDIISIAGTDGYFKRMSPAAERILGYSQEELLSFSFLDITHPQDLEKTKEELENLSDGQPTIKFENRYLAKDGSVVWLEWTATPVEETGLIYAIARDITSHKNLQFLVEKAGEMARIGSWEIDLREPDNGELYISDITAQILEADEVDSYKLQHFLTGANPETGENLKSLINDLRADDIALDAEIKLLTAKDDYRWVRITGQSEWVGGTCIRVYGSLQDIDERKKTELAFVKAANEKIEVLESIGDFFYALDNNFRFTYVNKTCADHLGESQEELLGKNVIELYPGLKQNGFYDQLKEVEKTGLPAKFEMYYDPFATWYDQSIYPKEDGFSVFFSDISDRKKAENDLAKFKKVIETSRDAIGIAALDGTVLFMNKIFKEATGLDEDTLNKAGSPVACYENPEAGRQMFETLQQGNYWKGDIKLKTVSGQTISTHLSAGPVVDDKGEVIAVYGIHTDISERIKAEEELKEAYEERNRILERITEAFFALDCDWNVTYWNKEAENIIGMKREALLGRNLWENFPLARQLRFFKEYERAFNEQVPVHFEEYFPPLNKWFEAGGYPSPEGISVFFRDITEKKMAEQLIRHSNERFEKVAQATNDAIWDLDVAKGTLYMGRGFNMLFGYDAEEMEQTREQLTKYIHPDDRANVIRAVDEALTNGSGDQFRQEYRLAKSNGGYSYVIDRGMVIRDEHGNAVRMVGAVTDITHRKEYENSLKKLNEKLKSRARELATSNAELEQFAYIASHDLQEPLRMITSFLAQLDKKYKNQLDDKARRYIHFAVDGAKRMRLIILDLLEFSRVGKYSGEVKPVDTQKVMDDVCLMLKRRIEESEARITAENLPVVMSYTSPLTQVFQNLVSNSLKYRKSDVRPEIEVSCTEENKFWRFRVSDNGIGISEDYHERIFNIFQRLHNKDEYSGTGMGLAIVQKIIDTLGGSICVESAEGKGSTFFFTLPKQAEKKS